MKYFTLFIFLTLFVFQSKSQCFEIESILVDACSNPEDENEMVRFKVGSSALSTSNLSVTWATTSNTWNGICQNATTATKVATLNSTILSCGYLKEPVGGVLPANAKVLLITSTAFNTSSANFANLTDTMYVIFQCNGSATSGNFGNHTASGIKTFSMNFGSTCTDVVTYNTSLLSQGGFPLSYDGGTVEYTPSGAATYINNGCQAPVSLFSVDAGPDKTVCATSSQSLVASAYGYTSLQWSVEASATGTLSSVNSLTTTYTPGVGESGSIKLYCSVSKPCGTQTLTVKDSVYVTILNVPLPIIYSSANSICPGQSATLSYSLSNASSSNTTSILWLPSNLTTPTITVNSAAVYSIQVFNTCGSNITTYTITVSSVAPTLSISSTPTVLCAGQTATLSLFGSTGNYNWTNGATTQTTSVTLPGVYSATVTNGCGTTNAIITLASSPSATVTITPTTAIICNNQSVVLTASSNTTNFLWNTGAITNTVSVNTAGIKTVTVSNQCGLATATINVISGSVPSLNITSTSNTLCPNQTATLVVTGGSSPYTWSNSLSTGSVVTTSGGVITVSSTNTCGTGTTSITVFTTSVNASISANPTIGVKPLLVNFNNNSSGATTYTWSFGNGNTSTTALATSQTYTAGGDYVVYLIASNGLCYDIDSLIITVLNEEPGLTIPNVFTPNGDNVNDVFKVNGFNISNFNGIIYDRWGLQLFSWNDVKQGWDGKISGKLATEGTYFYIINATDISDKTIKKQGSFLLIR